MPDSQSPSLPDDLRLSRPEAWVRAQVIPLAIFMGFSLLLQGFSSFFAWEHPSAPWWRHWPEQWLYPLQTLITLAALAKFRRFYDFRGTSKWVPLAVLFGVIGIGFWLLPGYLYDHMGLTGETSGLMKWLGIAPRNKGFNPADAFGWNTPAYWTALILRFLRAVVVVALAEEIFWRNFLMRFVEDHEGDYWKRPFGKPGWKSFTAVTFCFVFAHQPVDYAGAVIYGALTYALCVRTRSLGACVIMHATANLLMGLYAVGLHKYGLW